MPELPEVEIITRGLRKRIIGRKIESVDIRLKKIFHGLPKIIEGTTIKSVERRAKMIVISFDNNHSLLVHLKMTGQLVFDESKGDKTHRTAGGHPSDDWVADLPNKFTHVIFHFSDGAVLYFNDQRQFGYIKLLPSDDVEKVKSILELGPEPFSDELTPEYLMSIFAKRPRIKIKQMLLDQRIMSGVGNIYADESLFCAEISPLRLAKDVQRTEIMKLIGCVKVSLEKGLKYGGSSENTFVNAEGKKGQMQNHFSVYRRTGEPCQKCKGRIVRVVVGGRGTHYCPACQL